MSAEIQPNAFKMEEKENSKDEEETSPKEVAKFSSLCRRISDRWILLVYDQGTNDPAQQTFFLSNHQ